MSIMAHEVRIMTGKTFQLALLVCTPYNADFDGDEMNLHVPQSEEARAEAQYLLKVQEHILSPRYGGPIIGGVHDFISLAYIFTRKSSMFDRNTTYHWDAVAGWNQRLDISVVRMGESKVLLENGRWAI